MLILMVGIKPEMKDSGVDATFDILSFGSATDDISISIKSSVTDSGSPAGIEFTSDILNSTRGMANTYIWN